MVRLVAAGLVAVALLGGSAASATENPAPRGESETAPPPNSEGRSAPPARPDILMERIDIVGDGPRARGIPGSAHLVSSIELDQQNQIFGDIHRILFRIPGLNIQEEDGFGLRPNIGMRGSGSERSSNITLMEDGVLIAPAPYSAPAAYYFPLCGRMSGVEVRKGSSQIRFGPRTNGGALNLRSTPIPSRLSGRIDLGGGGRGTRKAHAYVGGRGGNTGWLAESYHLQSDGFKELDGGGNTGFDLQDYVAKFRVNSGSSGGLYQELEVKAGYTDERSNETYLGLTDADFEETPFRRYAASQRDVMDAEHWQVQARHFVEAPGGFDVTTTVYHNDFHRNWFKLDKVAGTGIDAVLADPQSFAQEYAIVTGAVTSAEDGLAVKANNRDYYAQGIESVVGLRFDSGPARHAFELGARLHRDEEDRFQHTDRFQMIEGGEMLLTERGEPGAAGGGDNRVNRARAAALFVQDDARLGRLTLTPGLRFEHVELTREQYAAGDPGRDGEASETNSDVDVLVPGLGLHYRLSRRLGVFAGVHRGFAPPGPGAVERTRVESSVNTEAGGRFRAARVEAEALGFLNAYSNLLGKDTFAAGGTGSGDVFNAGKVDVYGLEASLKTEMGRGDHGGISVPIRLAYTFTHGEFRESFASDFEPWGEVEAGDELPYLPEHQLALGVGLRTAAWLLDLSSNFQSAMRTVAGQGAAPSTELTDERLLLDATAEYSLRSGARIFASVQNVTDEAYIVARRPAGVRPGLPRTLLAGIKVGLN